MTRGFYLPEDASKRSESTMKFWNSTPEQIKWFNNAVLMGKNTDRGAVLRELRNMMDVLYNEVEGEVVIYSDFPAFDIGYINALLAEEGLLPLYLKSDDACPVRVLDMSSYMLGLAKLHPNKWSSDAAKALKIKMNKTTSHDALVDVGYMMDTVCDLLAVVD